MDKQKIFFMTFANKDYMKTERIAKQSEDLCVFDKIIQLNEDDISEYIKKHSSFIKNNRYGFGYWIWKPKVIYDTLNKMNNNDIMVYCDAGMYVNKNGKSRFNFYINQLNKNELVVFETNSKFKAQQFVKNDAIMKYHPSFNDEWTPYCYAGVMIIKKTKNTLNLISDWLELCENYHFIDKSPSTKYKDFSYYVGNDCDNGLFNLCLSKYKIDFRVTPDEINLYNKEGIQIAHTDINQKDVDWSVLDNIPFQVRRMTPKFGYK